MRDRLGDLIEHQRLSGRARWFAEAIALNAADLFVKLIEVRRNQADQISVVILDVQPEVPSRPKVDIRASERIGIVFHDADDRHPQALALRDDFPQEVSHRNHCGYEDPVNLCLTDRSWPEIRGSWTPIWMVGRVRWWLAETARARLHRDGQALEPFVMATSVYLEVPPHLRADVTYNIQAPVGVASDHQRCYSLVESTSPRHQPTVRRHLLIHQAKAIVHGRINKQPRTLRELCHLMGDTTGDDLRALLVHQLRAIPEKSRGEQALLFLRVPLLRSVGGDVAGYSDLAYLVPNSSITAIGISVAAWADPSHGFFMGPPPSDWGSLGILPLNIVYRYDRVMATTLSGHAEFPKTLLVGAGAIGSHTMLALARSGIAETTILDKDIILPHNLVRHVLGRSHVGRPKAVALAEYLHQELDVATRSLEADMLSLQEGQAAAICAELERVDLVLDCSASTVVSLRLTHHLTGKATRYAACFLNPSGRDLVVMMESRDRRISVSDLEMHYLREIVTGSRLAGHLALLAETGVRYGRGCSDRSMVLASDVLSMFGGMAAAALRSSAVGAEGRLTVFRRMEDGGVAAVELDGLQSGLHVKAEEWTICVHAGVLAECRAARLQDLPRETGGVLVGRIDRDLRIMQVVANVPAPSDSLKSPTGFVRGRKGLRQAVDKLVVASAGQLTYLGEWHSHPAGSSVLPSSTDITAMCALREKLYSDGMPVLQVIFGDDERLSLAVMG